MDKLTHTERGGGQDVDSCTDSPWLRPCLSLAGRSALYQNKILLRNENKASSYQLQLDFSWQIDIKCFN